MKENFGTLTRQEAGQGGEVMLVLTSLSASDLLKDGVGGSRTGELMAGIAFFI